jgi:glucose/mannose transport system permease protein
MTNTLARRITRPVLYALAVLMAVFYLIPVYVLLVTGLKSFAEVDLQRMWDLPTGFYFDNFVAAFNALAPNLWNSIRLVVPSSILSSMVGSINGYVLAKWKFRYSDLIFTLILFGMFIPYQSILIPLVQFMQWLGLRGTITGLILVHVIYGIPITTLIFRNYYAGIPTEVLEAGRIDGAGLLGLYRHIVFPLSIPGFVVVLIWQFTQAYNDFLFAVVLTRNETWPITVALNNLAGSQIVQWNVQMAGALLAALPTLLIYIFLGRFFLRGLMAGALKG